MTVPEKPKAMPHQEAGVDFLRRRTAAALFDEQGLGKSKQMIDAIAADIRDGTLDGALVICPNILKTTWAEEVEKHSGLSVAVFGSGRKERRDTYRKLRARFYVINYEAVAAEAASLKALLRFKRFALVLDESHRIKTPGAKVTDAIFGLRANAAKRYIMSGTPVANTPQDLWSQLFFLDDGERLGETFEEFKRQYVTSSGGYMSIDVLRSRLVDVSLRREKDGTVSLPPKTTARIPVQMSGKQLELYTSMREELHLWVRDLSGDEVLANAENILTRLIRLAQLASNPRLVDSNYHEVPTKYDALDRLLATYLQEDEKVIVWSSFVPNIEILHSRYSQYGSVTLHGEMTSSQKQSAVTAFRNDASVRLLIANPAAAREGLTLTQARRAIYLDRTFNLVDFLQSQDRIHRLSQTKDCEIIILLAKDSVDELIDYALGQKHRLARYTQGDVEEISASDLALQKPDLLRALAHPNDQPGKY